MQYDSLVRDIIRNLKDTDEYKKIKESVIQMFKENDYRRLPYIEHDDPEFPGLKILSDKETVKDDTRFLYKYVSTSKVMRNILGSDGGIRFCEPTEWDDKYESIFYRTHNCLDDRLASKKVFVSCFTTKPENEAAWRAYLKSDTKENLKSALVFRLKINRAGMRRELINQFRNESLYEAPVAYLHKKQISGALNVQQPKIKGFPPGAFDKAGVREEKDYISLLSMKRDYFSYEEELRYFIVSDVKDAANDTNYKYLKNVLKFVKKITVVRPYGDISIDKCEGSGFELSSEELEKLADELHVSPSLLESYNPYKLK